MKLIKAMTLGLLMTTQLFEGFAPMAFAQKKDEDYLWLENIEEARALAWVHQQNEHSLAKLRAFPDYAAFKSEALKILEAKDKIPYGTIRGDYVYNFWQDAQHVRGIWRRASFETYSQGKPQWETLLDIDALAIKEGKNYVFSGSKCLRPRYERCLIQLSEGGSDASFYREFNIATKAFVTDGFNLPVSKSGLSWLDENQVYLSNALTPEVQTDSGYSMEVRLWKRGTPVDKSTLLFTGQKSDMMVHAAVAYDGDQQHVLVYRRLSFYTSEVYYLRAGKLVKLPLPLDSEISEIFQGKVLLQNRSAIGSYPAGSLLAISLEALLKGEDKYELVFTPSAQQALSEVARSRDYIYVQVLDQVRSKILRLELKQEGGKSSWTSQTLPLDDTGTISMPSVDEATNRMFVSYTDFISPAQLYYVDGKERSKKMIMQAPSQFNAAGLAVSQRFAQSADGTKIPYFLVHKKDLPLNGKNPTLLYGYGGFEVSMQPGYSGLLGKLWLERGGVYVMANIRGGGEFGPKWHQAALKENRQKAFDDFIAVAEDLVKQKITSAEHLGIHGGSNGGLLVGAVFTQRPELFKGVICAVPLLDMLRFHKLLAGASWMAEYGSPEDPKMAEVLRRYSPFHNLDSRKTYPEVLFITSTKDDRVHPGHARKMAAKMADLKKPFLYYENTEGGHSASANLQQRAEQQALQYSYLWQMLAPQKKNNAL